MFLVNSRFPQFCATPSRSESKSHHATGVLLLPKLRRQFAEFLNHSYPTRLGMLYLSTCVGLGYGHHVNCCWAFLGSIGSMTSPEAARYHVSEFMRPGFTWSSSYTLTPVLPFTGFIYLPASPYSFPQQCGSVRVDRSQHSPLATEYWDGREHGGTGISTSCASTTPLGLALAPDSPWEDWPRPGTLGHTAEGVLTPHSLLMPTFALERAPRLGCPAASLHARRSATTRLKESHPRLRY